jgi:YhcH/YjgK/YiaL family protein
MVNCRFTGIPVCVIADREMLSIEDARVARISLVIDKVENAVYVLITGKNSRENGGKAIFAPWLKQRMIVDRIENAYLYSRIPSQIGTVLKILSSREISSMTEGKHEIEGNKVFYLVQKYSTKPRNEGQMEAHKKYIDIQYVLNGQESIFVENIAACKLVSAYNEEDDAAMYEVPKSFSEIYMSKGMFCILFPQDSHLACRTTANESKVHKIVFKVAV